MRFITSAYGNAYSAFLAVFLRSVHKNCPESPVTVYWQDMDDDIIEAIRSIFPSTQFVKTNFSITGSANHKIPSKMKLWLKAMEESHDESVCLIDSDMIVQRDPALFLNDADCIFTDKKEQFQLNTGIVLLRNSPSALCFLNDWTKKTIAIVENPALLEQAVSPKNHYGAADQMALYTLIDYKPEKKEYAYPTPHGQFTLKAEPCTFLNQTNSVPLSPDIYIYHYKGGWRDVLLKGIHSPYRPKRACLPMHSLYLAFYRDVLCKLRRVRTPRDTIGKIHLHVPTYFDMEKGTVLYGKLYWELARDTLKKCIRA